jgi:predicted metal-dependent peptidase
MLALGKELTTEQRLTKAVVDIMGHERYVALAGILMIGDRKIDDNCPTAYTNGRDEGYGRGWLDKQSDAQARFGVLHENYHKLYKHLTTWRHLWEENPQLANISSDFVINLKIADDNKHDGFAVAPDGILLDERFRGMNTAEVYNILKKEGGGGGYTSFDHHDWEGAKELSDQEQRELEQEIDEAIRQGALMAGKLGKGDPREMQDLLTPQVDYREVLREFVCTHCAGKDYSTYRSPNRRYMEAYTDHDIFMPDSLSESINGVVFAPDMSSSIGDDEQRVFVSEAKGCFDTVKPSWVHVLYWTTRVERDEKYTLEELDDFARTTRPTGSGGTDVECVPPYMKDKNINPQAVIVLTDGYLSGNWGKWDCPVLWVVVNNKGAKPPSGVVLHVTSDQLLRG